MGCEINDHHRSVITEHAGNFGQYRFGIGGIVQHLVQDNAINLAITDRQMVKVTQLEFGFSGQGSFSGLVALVLSELRRNTSTSRPVPVPISRKWPRLTSFSNASIACSTASSGRCSERMASHSSAWALKYCSAISARALRTSASFASS